MQTLTSRRYHSSRGRSRPGDATDPRDLIGPFSHRVTIEVRFADTDAMGHVNNAKYLTYCEIARIKYWTDVTGEPIAPARRAPRA